VGVGGHSNFLTGVRVENERCGLKEVDFSPSAPELKAARIA
jgi:hypothetical protein